MSRSCWCTTIVHDSGDMMRAVFIDKKRAFGTLQLTLDFVPFCHGLYKNVSLFLTVVALSLFGYTSLPRIVLSHTQTCYKPSFSSPYRDKFNWFINMVSYTVPIGQYLDVTHQDQNINYRLFLFTNTNMHIYKCIPSEM